MSNKLSAKSLKIIAEIPSYVGITGAALRAMCSRVADVETATLTAEIAQYKAEAPLCEKHQPKGGTRATCLVCVCIKLSAAISRIDYALGEPNEMNVSGYDVHCNEDEVVQRARDVWAELAAMKAERDALVAALHASNELQKEVHGIVYQSHLEKGDRLQRIAARVERYVPQPLIKRTHHG